MSQLPIVCGNCGAKYRLPETFTADQAKCKQCGSQIDVAGQRQAAASPATGDKPAAAAVPAAARPARQRRGREEKKDTDKQKATPASAAGAAAGRRSSRRAKDAEAGAEDAPRAGRRSRGEGTTESGSKMPLVLGGIGAIAVVVVILVLMSGNGDQPAETNTTQNQNANQPADQGRGPGAQEADAQKNEAARAAEAAAAKKAEADAAEAARAGDPEAGAADAQAAPARPPEPEVAPGERWKLSKVSSMDRVFDPMTEIEPVAWPDYVTAAEQTHITELLDTIRFGGKEGPGAKTELEKMGHKALAGIINRLREVDYKDSFASMYAWELNKLLDAMTLGLNVGFVAVTLGEDVDPRKADWNAKTAQAWQGLLTKYATPEAWVEMRRLRSTRHNK